MKKIFYILLLAVSLFSSCDKKIVEVTPYIPTLEQTGSLQFDLSHEGDNYIVKAANNVSVDDFTVTITRKMNNNVRTWKYSEIPDVLELVSGNYKIEAASPQGAPAAFDQPTYYGSQDIVIAVGKVSTVNLVCGLSNMKVTMECTDNFLNELTDFSVTVTNTNGNHLAWYREEVLQDKAGYFEVLPFDVDVTAYRWSDTGRTEMIKVKKSIGNVAAKDHHIIKLDAKVTGQVGGDGQPGIEVTIDNTVKDKPVNVEIPGLTDIPVDGGEDGGEEGEDPGDNTPAAPSLVWEANPSFAVYEIWEGKDDIDADMVINAPGKIKDFKVVATGPEGFMYLVNLMTTKGTTPGETPDGVLDLINDPVTVEKFGGLGLPVANQLTGQVSVDFKLTTFISLLSTQIAAGDTATFTLNVTDENGKTLSQPVSFYRTY